MGGGRFGGGGRAGVVGVSSEKGERWGRWVCEVLEEGGVGCWSEREGIVGFVEVQGVVVGYGRF